MPSYPLDPAPINVGEFLKNPTRITRQITQLVNSRGTIADYAFSTGPASQGAVVYDQITGNTITPERDVEVIAPGTEFPEVVDYTSEEKIARVDTYGGKVELTRQAINRNDNSELTKKMSLLSTLVTNRINAVAVQAITTSPLVQRLDLATDWGATGEDPIGDILVATGMINNNDLGYRADLVFINPMDAAEYFLGRKDVRDQLPRENPNLNPVLSATLGRLANLEWVESNKVPRGKFHILQRGVSASLRDEEGGIQSNSFYNNDRHVRTVQSWRTIVPIITDPKSIVEVSGFRGTAV